MQDEYETIVPDDDVTDPQLTTEFVSMNNAFVCSLYTSQSKSSITSSGYFLAGVLISNSLSEEIWQSCKRMAIDITSFIPKLYHHWPKYMRLVSRLWWINLSSSSIFHGNTNFSIVWQCKLTPNVRGPSYLGLTRSMSWLLMPISSHDID